MCAAKWNAIRTSYFWHVRNSMCSHLPTPHHAVHRHIDHHITPHKYSHNRTTSHATGPGLPPSEDAEIQQPESEHRGLSYVKDIFSSRCSGIYLASMAFISGIYGAMTWSQFRCLSPRHNSTIGFYFEPNSMNSVEMNTALDLFEVNCRLLRGSARVTSLPVRSRLEWAS